MISKVIKQIFLIPKMTGSASGEGWVKATIYRRNKDNLVAFAHSHNLTLPDGIDYLFEYIMELEKTIKKQKQTIKQLQRSLE